MEAPLPPIAIRIFGKSRLSDGNGKEREFYRKIRSHTVQLCLNATIIKSLKLLRCHGFSSTKIE